VSGNPGLHHGSLPRETLDPDPPTDGLGPFAHHGETEVLGALSRALFRIESLTIVADLEKESAIL
jgi:hypothetical protein